MLVYNWVFEVTNMYKLSLNEALSQHLPGFLSLEVCMFVSVLTPEGINDYLHEMSL